MAITSIKRNLTKVGPSGSPWLVQAYSADVYTAPEILLAGVTGTMHYISAIHVNCCPGTTAVYFTLIDDNGNSIMPRVDVMDYHGDFYHRFLVPLPCETGHGIRITSEAADAVSVIMEGVSVVVDVFKLDPGVPQASASRSASISSSPSASISSTPSASLSVSESVSASVSSTPSVSRSVSASISSTPSVSTSPSSSPSASISASPSWSG